MKIFDISIDIKPGMIIYPNNPEVKFTLHQGQTTRHTDMSMGTHTGTHIDAPFHAVDGAPTIDQLDPEIFHGKVRVFDVSGCGAAVKISDIEKYNIQKGERVMFKTSNSARGFDTFYEDYIYLDGDAADYLAEIGVKLVAIDYLSIKQKGSPDTRPHDSLLSRNIPIIEAVNLKDVDEGEYILSALPLKLIGLDGSPCRAILIKE